MPVHSYENRKGGHTVELSTNEGNLISHQDMTPFEYETFMYAGSQWGYVTAYHDFFHISFGEEAA